MPKKKETKEILEKIFDYTLEDIMGERFASYSKYIIQERAIPDARDGLKPVQRRILYSMYKEKNTYYKGYRKSAKTVGDVIGNYHPHGDTSIYDAMVRMSQPWKTRLPYIDMHGNNGSIDGDSPAAYRYTEARLSKIAGEMLKDIGRDSVEFAPNFDDTTKEPTVLPARFPALLVYGAQGISAGYATNMPPHNLNEVVDATIHLIDNPEATLEELMNFVKGPDFPTGGIVEGLDGLKSAYTTGKGRIIVKSKYEITNNQIIITEIPFETNKSLIVKKIDDIRLDKKIDGISEVRDESTSDIRIVIDLKKNANKDLIINYLLKNTDLQVSYNFNNVAIVNKRPKLLGLKDALDAFIKHQREVILRRTKFDLDHAKQRFEIVEGLIKCISILDEVIKVIRSSKNRSDAKENLIKEFGFTPPQSEAIITLQLYRLTNTDVVELKEELENLKKTIEALEAILSKESVLKRVMKKELEIINKNYVTPRLTEVKDEITEIKIDVTEMIPKENVIVLVTKDGYVKRSSIKSYKASPDDSLIKENDYVIGLYELDTLNNLYLFTNMGNYIDIPVHKLPDMKWRDMPKHISNIIPLNPGEEIISSIPVTSNDLKKNIVLASSLGMIKRVEVSTYKLQRCNKPQTAMKLKENDSLIDAFIETKDKIFISTDSGYGLSYKIDEIPVVGKSASGVKSMKLKDDHVVSINNFNDSDEFISVITNKGTGKRIRLTEFPLSSRARRGLQLIRDVKANPYKILNTFIVDNRNMLGLKNNDIEVIKITNLPISDRASTGSSITKHKIDKSFIVKTLTKEEKVEEQEETEEVKEVDLNDIDNRLMTIDDFIN